VKIGDLVKEKFSDKTGICQGPIFKYGVWWILVKYPSGKEALVLENSLELINKNPKGEVQ